MKLTSTLFLIFCSVLVQKGYSLQLTSIPPLLDVPTYSLATRDNDDGKTGMNIVTYATPVSITPDRIWSIGLYKGTVTHENFSKSKKGVLQLLSPKHSKIVALLGGKSNRDVDKRLECEKLGFEWISLSTSGDEDCVESSGNPEVLPDCACYLVISLVGDLIDCGSHDVALCKVESILVGNGQDAPSRSYLNTASLRKMGIITEQGRVAEKKD